MPPYAKLPPARLARLRAERAAHAPHVRTRKRFVRVTPTLAERLDAERALYAAGIRGLRGLSNREVCDTSQRRNGLVRQFGRIGAARPPAAVVPCVLGVNAAVRRRPLAQQQKGAPKAALSLFPTNRPSRRDGGSRSGRSLLQRTRVEGTLPPGLGSRHAPCRQAFSLAGHHVRSFTPRRPPSPVRSPATFPAGREATVRASMAA